MTQLLRKHGERGCRNMVLCCCFGLLGVLAMAAGCSDHPSPAQEGKGSADSANASEHGQHVRRGTNGEVFITLTAAAQTTMGLKTITTAAATVTAEIRCYGRVLDTSGLVALVAERSVADAAATASEAELKRLKTLAGQNNAAPRTVEAAEAAAARDRAQSDAGRLRILSAWGSAIATNQDLAGTTKGLASMEQALVVLELPPGQSIAKPPVSARVVSLADPDNAVQAEYLGRAPFTDSQTQGLGFMFLVKTNTLNLAPGAAVSGFLNSGGESMPGVLVPRDCVLRYNGLTWVYRQTGEAEFERVAIIPERSLPEGWFVRGTVRAGDKLVSRGAQQLLSEELKTEDVE